MKQVSIFVALLAFVSSTKVLAKRIELMPESALFPTDDEELQDLEEKVFSDFCLSTRDYVSDEVKKEPTDLAGQLVKYGRGFTPGSRFLLERASSKLFSQVENPDAPIEGLFANYPYDSYIEDGMQKIKQVESYSDRYMIALTYVWLTYSKFSTDELESKFRQANSQEEMDKIYRFPENDRSNMVDYLAAIRDQFVQSKSKIESKDSESSVEAQLRSALKLGCSEFDEYKNVIHKKFEEMKADIVSKDASMTRVKLDNIGCLTCRRVLNAVAVCDFIETATRPIMSILRKEA